MYQGSVTSQFQNFHPGTSTVGFIANENWLSARLKTCCYVLAYSGVLQWGLLFRWQFVLVLYYMHCGLWLVFVHAVFILGLQHMQQECCDTQAMRNPRHSCSLTCQPCCGWLKILCILICHHLLCWTVTCNSCDFIVFLCTLFKLLLNIL